MVISKCYKSGSCAVLGEPVVTYLLAQCSLKASMVSSITEMKHVSGLGS